MLIYFIIIDTRSTLASSSTIEDSADFHFCCLFGKKNLRLF
jgi:hypothetical protein